MHKTSIALLFFFLFFSLYSINAFAVYTSMSGHDEDFTTSASQSLLSYEYTSSNCFAKTWYSSYRDHQGVVALGSNCSVYTTHTFYLKDDITTNWNSPYPLIAQAVYYVNTTTNWNPDNRPSFYVWDYNTSEKLYETNLSTSDGWNVISLTGDLTIGHHYWLVLDFKTWESMPSVQLAVDSMTFGTMIGSGISTVLDTPIGCYFKSNTSYYYPYNNFLNQSNFTVSQTSSCSNCFIGFGSIDAWIQTFKIPQNATLTGIMLKFLETYTPTSPTGYFNWTLKEYNGEENLGEGSIIISDENWNATSGWLSLDLSSSPTLTGEDIEYELEIYRVNSQENYKYQPAFQQNNPYADGMLYYHDTDYYNWHDTTYYGYNGDDLSFVINLTLGAGEKMPDAIQKYINNWDLVSIVGAYDGNSWNIYNKTSGTGNLSYIYIGNIFYVNTINNTQYNLKNCMKDDCESYSENTINPFPYSFGVMPSVISSRISNWNDVDTIFGYDGSNWLFYDPDDIDSSTLISLQKGQAFYIDTKSDSGFVLGNQFYGTKCDENDITGRGYTIYNGCNQAYQVCPANTKCSQITPQAKITTPLIEDFTDCSMCWSLNTFVGNKLIWTNCPNNPECICEDAGLCKANVYRANITSAPFSVLEYTIGCYDPYGQRVLWIINSTGQNTTQEALINQSLNQTIQITTPQANSVISLREWINTNLGTAYGSMLIAFICSIFFATTLFFKMEDKKIENFAVPFLASLGGFSLPGVEFFPLWIWLLMTVFTGVLIFWKAKG